jgi:hypothetical protein
MNCICPCGNLTKKSYGSVRVGQKCKECGYRDRGNGKYSFDYVKKCFEEGGCSLLEDEYLGIKVPLKYRCSCGNIGKTAFYNFLKGVRCRKCGIKKTSGPNNWKYKHDLTEEERERGRLDSRLRVWKNDIKRRDGFKCNLCLDNKGGNLVSHHLDGYNWNKKLRYELSNGITLCKPCHLEFHSMFGYGDNTRKQFEEFILYRKKEVKDVIPQ